MEVIKRRRSIRGYRPDPVPEGILNQILKAARLAPSGGNRQPWHFIIVKDPETKRRLDMSSWAVEAPIVLIGCTEGSAIDISIAFEHIVLAATNFGLGTCWMGRWGYDAEIKKALRIPEHIRVLAVTPVGYPAEEPEPKPRKSLSEITHYEKF